MISECLLILSSCAWCFRSITFSSDIFLFPLNWKFLRMKHRSSRGGRSLQWSWTGCFLKDSVGFSRAKDNLSQLVCFVMIETHTLFCCCCAWSWVWSEISKIQVWNIVQDNIKGVRSSSSNWCHLRHGMPCEDFTPGSAGLHTSCKIVKKLSIFLGSILQEQTAGTYRLVD